MNYFIRIFLLNALFFTGFPINGKSQPVQKNLNINTVLSGYKERIVGEVANYHSSNPDVNDALIARCSDSNNIISWKTEDIPASYKEKYIYFVWPAGLATGNNRENSSYDLYINDKKAFNIKVITKQFPQNWLLKGENGMELNFMQHSVDDNKDCFGFMYLKVPVDDYKKGAPLLLKMQGINNRRYDDWYMTFQYAVKEEATVLSRPLLQKNNNSLQQLVDIHINHILPQSVHALIKAGNAVKKEVELKQGYNSIAYWLPAVKTNKNISVSINIPQTFSFTKDIKLQPVTMREVYLIPCSHTDIGYSNLQPIVAKQHSDYIRQAMQIIDKSKNYPKGEKFKWNVESLWSVENFMKEATAQEKEQFVGDVKNGSIGLSAGYINLLTGVCRPEELIHWTDYSDTLHRSYDIDFKSLMISDVPGMSWNVVTALSQRGVRYVSDGPNYIPHQGFPDIGGRVGATHRAWGDKPFYWVSPSGADTILFWQAGKGYSWFQDWNVGRLGTPKSKDSLLNYMQELEDKHYPYGMVQLRYSIINDNQPPDPGLPDFVADWNKKYTSPRLIISNVDDMMKTFEQHYSDKLPVMSGDFTPYWEDGVMSTAKEEALVKYSVERLYQSEVLNSLLFPGNYDKSKYYQAWRNVTMWHEHTWGAWNSISHPDDSFAIKQWIYKQNFALQADTLSRQLLKKSIENNGDWGNGFNIINTSSWERTDLVILTKAQSTVGDVIVDEQGKAFPSQRLSDGRLAFLAKDIPALGSKRFYNKKGASSYKSGLKISGNTIENNALRLILDKKTGAIMSLKNKANGLEFVDTSRYKGLNQYLYMPGKNPSQAISVNNVAIKIKENGPLISTFEMTAEAPGTQQIIQEVSLINELNKLSITDIVDKTKVREKESVHFAFPVKISDGQMRVDIGTGIMKPEKNQLTGANKDYFSMQRWVDISNKQEGLTFTTREVPLIEEGELVNELPYASSESYGGVSGEKKWKEHATISNTFFSYTMNNYWYTNYKADQEGKVTFHYAIYLHDQFDPAAATRKGIEDCQQLLVTTAKSNGNLPFQVNDKHILLTSVKPSAFGQGLILRLYNASSQAQQLHFIWNAGKENNISKIYLSNANEDKLKPFDLQKSWEPFAVKTLYIE